MTDGSWSSGSPFTSPVSRPRFSASPSRIRCQIGVLITAIIMAINKPVKLRPTCHKLKEWLLVNTSGNAPKNRYRMPSRMAE